MPDQSSPALPANDLPENDEPVLIFQHIEKAGGTTLARVFMHDFDAPTTIFFDPYFNPNHPYRSHWEPHYTGAALATTRVAYGHHWFGGHKIWEGRRPTRYCSLVRDPVEQLLSMYHYALPRRDHRLHPMTHDGFDSFIARLADEPRLSLYLNNPQSQALARSTRLRDVAQTLEEHYCFLAPVENLDMLGRWFFKTYLNHDMPSAPERQNVSEKRMTPADVSDATARRIYACNHLDRIIHRGAQRLGATRWTPVADLFMRVS